MNKRIREPKEILYAQFDYARDDVPDNVDDIVQELYDWFPEFPNIEFEVIEQDGPGGGWPLIGATGPSDELHDFLYNYFEGDMEMVEQSLEEFKEPYKDSDVPSFVTGDDWEEFTDPTDNGLN